MGGGRRGRVPDGCPRGAGGQASRHPEPRRHTHLAHDAAWAYMVVITCTRSARVGGRQGPAGPSAGCASGSNSTTRGDDPLCPYMVQLNLWGKAQRASWISTAA